jgi:hypothetical protein
MSFRGEVALALLLVLVVALGVAGGRRRAAPAERDGRTSTLRAGPSGSEALYEVQRRLGQPVERRRAPLFDLARDSTHRPGLLVVAAPPVPLSPAELSALGRYVETGGAVFGAGGAGGITACVGWAAVAVGTGFPPESGAVSPPTRGLALPPVTRVLQERAGGATPGADTDDREPAMPSAERGDTRCAALRPRAADTLLRTVRGQPVVVGLRYDGGGRVTLLAASEYLTNRVWRTSDVPYVLAPLLAPPRGGLVAWDEYHQGFGDAPSLAGVVLAWLVRAPAGWALLHMAAVVLVGLAVAALRFGPARPGVVRARRSPLEHVDALAAGLEGAGGGGTAVRLMLSGLRRRLSRAAAPTGGDPEQWLAALQLAVPGAQGREAAARLHGALRAPEGPGAAVVAAHAVEDVWEALHPRRTPG